MLNIEYREDKERPKSPKYIVVNGKEDRKCYIYNSLTIKNPKGLKSITLHNHEVIENICNATLFELQEYFGEVGWRYIGEYEETISINIYLIRDMHEYRKYPVLKLGIEIDWETWANKWSIKDFANELSKCASALNNENIEYFQDDEIITNGFGLVFYIDSCSSKLEDVINDQYAILKECINNANKNLISRLSENSHVTIYEFPEEFKPACEQYLIYFTQFLKDIGIEATSDLKNESGKVLFSVTPKDKGDGLERIKDALDIYLRLPAASGIDVYESSEIAVQQLQANIFHLKGQLVLAKSSLQLKEATIQSNNATIEALQLSNYQYKNLLDEANKKLSSEEPILGGVVKLKSYEKFGVKLDLAEIFRKLKRK